MRPATGGAATIYLVSKGQVTPVWTATRTAGTPIGDNVDGQDQTVLAATPDGKTLYVADTEMGWVTPISTATNVAGPRITTGAWPYAIAVTPDGSTAYVVSSEAGTVTPISTATGVPGRPIRIVGGSGGAGFPRNLGGGAGAGGHGPAFLATGVLPVRWPAP